MSKDFNVGGRLKFFREFWDSITEDRYILEAISGVKLDFESIPSQLLPQPEIYCSFQEKIAIEAELEKYLELGIISKAEHSEGQFVSKIFSRPKKNGKIRIILDLSILNEDVKYEHFKMENFNTALSLVSEICFLVPLTSVMHIILLILILSIGST